MKISKNFSEKVWRFGKKMYFCTPKRKEGATGTAGRPETGHEADAERRVH